MSVNIKIKHLYISPGHNYFAHYGKPPGDNPIIEVDRIECVAGRGIRNDRFFDYKQDYKGQITFFSFEVFKAMQQEFNLPDDLTPACTRRNVIVEGIDLNSLIGKEFEIQGVRFFGTEECRPCFWMNTAFRDERIENWLKGRGGLRAKILSDGILKVDGKQ